MDNDSSGFAMILGGGFGNGFSPDRSDRGD